MNAFLVVLSLNAKHPDLFACLSFEPNVVLSPDWYVFGCFHSWRKIIRFGFSGCLAQDISRLTYLRGCEELREFW
jgi:hypothetical protein